MSSFLSRMQFMRDGRDGERPAQAARARTQSRMEAMRDGARRPMTQDFDRRTDRGSKPPAQTDFDRRTDRGSVAPTMRGGNRRAEDSTPRRQEAFNATAAAGMQGVTAAPGVGPAPEPAKSYWQQNAAAEQSAREAGEAANKARLEQKMGYLSRGMGLPDTSDTTKDAYWARADMAAWANANPALAAQQGWVGGRNYGAAAPGQLGSAPASFSMSGENPVSQPGATYQMSAGALAPQAAQAPANFSQEAAGADYATPDYRGSVNLRGDGTPLPAITGETVFNPATPKGQALEILEGTFKPAIKEAQVEMAQQAAAPAAVNEAIQQQPFDDEEGNPYSNSYGLRRFF